MSYELQSFTHVQLIGIKERVLIISLLIVLFVALTVPIYQADINRRLTLTSNSLKNELVEQDEYERLLLSYITKQSLPEVVSNEAISLNLSFQKLPFKDAQFVLMEDVIQ